MAVYTKTGDKGKTSTFSGKRVLKSSKLINTIGTIDELNSYLGIIGGLTEIQKNLFTINAILIGAKLKFSDTATKELEKEIDKMEGGLPVQKNFIIYSGTKKSRKLFYARALCRSAERALVNLNLPDSLSHIPIYINRLSDYLFILARWENHKKHKREIYWKS